MRWRVLQLQESHSMGPEMPLQLQGVGKGLEKPNVSN